MLSVSDEQAVHIIRLISVRLRRLWQYTHFLMVYFIWFRATLNWLLTQWCPWKAFSSFHCLQILGLGQYVITLQVLLDIVKLPSKFEVIVSSDRNVVLHKFRS